MADEEAKDVPSTNEEVAEAEPQEVPDQNVDQNQEETGVSETNATVEAEPPQTEEVLSEEPPPAVQEQSTPAPDETAVVQDGEAPETTDDMEATTGDDSAKDAVQDEEKAEEAPEESKADETREDVAPPEEIKDKDEGQSEKPSPSAEDAADDSQAAQEEDGVTKPEMHKTKTRVSIRWEDNEENADQDVPPEESKDKAEEEEGESPEAETEKMQMEDGEGRLPDQIHQETSERVEGSDELENDEKEMERNEAGDIIESAESAQERSRLIEQYQQCISVRDTLQQQNAQIQQKLAEFFRKKKPEDSRADKEAKNVAELEQRYLKLMAQIEELQEKQEIERNAQMHRIEELEHQCAEKKDRVNADQRKLTDMKRMVAQHAMNSRSGKPIAEKDIDQYLANEAKKDTELEWVRLENIKLKNKLKKKELQLKSKEELAEGLHLIDFEQLKIENQTYNEKIEERNEELQKLRKKIKSTVEVQTHMKEKLQFIEVENEVLYKELQEIEGQVAHRRDELSHTKQMRDALKRSNLDLHKNCGLLGNRLLLRNFEEQKDFNQELLQQLEDLKMTYAEYTMQAKHVQNKIDQATHQQTGY